MCPMGCSLPAKPADLIIFSDTAEWTVDKNAFASKGRNTPFHGVTLKGRNLVTIVGGKIVYNGLSGEHRSHRSWRTYNPSRGPVSMS